MFPSEFVEKTKTHILCLVTFFPKNGAVYEIMENYGRARRATDDNIIRRMRCACWITKATSAHSEYVMLIAFLLQQWLQERPSLLRYSTLPFLYQL